MPQRFPSLAGLAVALLCVLVAERAHAGGGGPSHPHCLSSRETKCDGTDQEDCDGVPDDDFHVGEPCVVGMGECAREGTIVCRADQKSARCDADPGAPSDETCDGKDNDCDGRTDEDFDLGQSCLTEEHGCRRPGRTACDDAGGVTCRPDDSPRVEICGDGVDNDCDGSADAADGDPESCGDGYDNDCDGLADEGCPCTPGSAALACYAGPAGTGGVGACRAGLQHCVAGVRGPCEGQVRPADEVCDNGLDDDCDGALNDDCGHPDRTLVAGRGGSAPAEGCALAGGAGLLGLLLVRLARGRA